MAYVLWKVFMKKYTKIKLELGGSKVTPATHKSITYDEESWKPTPEVLPSIAKEKSPESSSITPSSSEPSTKSGKVKKVKKYLNKCKNVLANSKASSSFDCETSSLQNSTSWYVESKLDDLIKTGEIHEVSNIIDENAEFLEDFGKLHFEVANIIHLKGPQSLEESELKENDESLTSGENFHTALTSLSSETLNIKDGDFFSLETKSVLNETDGAENNQDLEAAASPFLDNFQEQVDGVSGDNPEVSSLKVRIKSEVELLIDKYFSNIFDNYYLGSKKCLVRQARDLLVCEYHGCLSRFEEQFCLPASQLLQHLKINSNGNKCSPSGWPLCLGQSGIIVHFSPLDASYLRNRDSYLSLRSSSSTRIEIVLFWKINNKIYSKIFAEFLDSNNALNDTVIMCSSLQSVADLEVSYIEECDGTKLPELLENLLVSVEHAIERVPLDDLTFPCPQCHQYLPLDRKEDDFQLCACQCLCRLPDSSVSKKDSSIQTSPMFEFVGSIPHIDSDSDDDKESIRSGTNSKRMEIARPKTISELPDKLLMSGINLPGTTDNDGRPIILCFAECISRAALNKYEIAKLLLYYTSLPSAEFKGKGFTVLLLAENQSDFKTIEVLDKSICLLGNCLKINRFLIWRPGKVDEKEIRTLASQIEAIVVTEESCLKEYLNDDQTPASCGGSSTHDQLEWVEFYKQFEPFISHCINAGQSLLKILSHLRNEEVPFQINRRFLNHQCRQISKALDSDIVQKLHRDGNKTLSSLTERSQWLASSNDVKRSTSFAYDSFNAVERVTKRLEQLKMERMERLKELARFRNLQQEAEELIQWIQKVGDEKINSLTLLLRSTEDSISVKSVANDFDEFFFNAWKQIEKSNDLTEECKNLNDTKAEQLKATCSNLGIQMKSFKENLEDTRERIEDSSRCFLLLETCHDILDDDSGEKEEFFKLAKKSGNEKLSQLCKNSKNEESEVAQIDYHSDKDAKTSENIPNEFTACSTPHQKPQNAQIRRRSVSSMAYIFHCSHHAAGEMCNCCESDTENSVSYKLKKRYIQMHNCNCQSVVVAKEVERKNSGTLGGIKEERESVENLLEKIENCGRCDSGLSVGEESSNSCRDTKKKLERLCSCQYYKETCAMCSTGSSSSGSNQDNTELHQQDSIIDENNDRFNKSSGSDDIEDDAYAVEERRKIPPVPANNHLYCHASTINLPLDALYNNMDPKTQKTLTFIIKEMIETERDYVKSLDYIIVNYIPELQREDIPQALRGQRNTVFGNVEKIYEFHRHNFLEELEECEHNPLQVGQIFLKYDKRFYLYALYNKNKPKSDSLMSEYGSIFFKSKQIELGDKMDLASYLLKPVQRMGKYALLLQQMMKACGQPQSNSSERSIQDIEDLRQAEEMVRFQLRHGNDLLAMDSIRECDVNLKEQGRLLRQNEFLVWEGRGAKKSLRQVFLFEELILFSKARRLPDRKNLDLYIYKNSIKMTDIGLTARIGESPTKFEIWFRKRKPNDTFTLQSMSEDVKKAWTEELSQLLWKQAIRNRAVRMAEMSSMGIGNKPCLDIRPSADQISDRSISIAQLSKNLHSEFCTITRTWRVNAMLLCNSFLTAPRFRNSIAGSTSDSCRTIKRPHSVISVSSVSSSSTSSGGSGGHSTSQGNSSIGFESNYDSPKPYRSATLNSQCSVESGIIADISVTSDDYTDQSQQPHTNTS